MIRKSYVMLISLSLFFLFSCENPLLKGLGDSVDLNAPDVEVIGTQNGAYLRGIATINGTFSDDKEVTSVELSFNGGGSYFSAEIDSSDKTWSFEVDTTDEATYGADGEKEIYIRAADVSGKQTETRLLVYFDNKSPTVMIKVPGVNNAGLNGDVFIKGEAADQFGIQQVRVALFDSITGTQFGSDIIADGTNSWSALFSSEYSGNYYVQATATDRSGNENTHYYHFEDIYALADSMTIEKMNRVENTRVAEDGLEPSELDPHKRSRYINPMVLDVTQDADLPLYVISNPGQGVDISENVLPPTAKFIGLVSDDDGVSLSGGLSPQIRIWNHQGTLTDTSDDTIEQDWTDLDISGSGLSVRWEYDHPAPWGVGEYYLELRAWDIYGKTSVSSPVNYRIDDGIPSIEITSPVQGEYLNTNSFTITGTASSTNSITAVEVSIDGGSTYSAAVYTNPSWSFNVGPLADSSPLSIKARVTDNMGKSSSYNLQINVDFHVPTASFLTPQKSATVNGVITLKGTSSDVHTQVTSVTLKIGKAGEWVPYDLGNDYNWEKQIDTIQYSNSISSDETAPGSGTWWLPIQVRVEDLAGNVYINSSDSSDPDYYFIEIDNERDKPTVTIDSPTDGKSTGGSELFTGTAYDDDAIDKVYMQILAHIDDGVTLRYDAILADATVVSTDVDLMEAVTTTDFLDGSWIEVGDSNRWRYTLNEGGELYSSAFTDYDGTITVRIAAQDTKGGYPPAIAGPVETVTIRFDDTIPRIENIQIDGADYSSGDYVRDSFTLTGLVEDNSSVERVSISYDGGINWELLAQPSTATYPLSIPIDSTTIRSGMYNDSSGRIYIRIKAVDDTDYQSIKNVDLNIDNLAPEGAYDSSVGATVNLDSTDAVIQGTATDITGGATVGGVGSILVYLTRDDAGTDYVYNPQSVDTRVAAEIRDPGFGFGAITYPAAINENYIMVIDDRDEGGSDAGIFGDGDDYDESLIASGTEEDWSVAFNSENIPDGPITVHYIVLDEAGNGSHYTKEGFIANDPPQITVIQLGTDLNADGTIDPAEEENYSISETFTARNDLLSIEALTAVGGNTPFTYDLRMDGSGANLMDPDTSNNITLDTSGYTEGIHTFEMMVTDSVGLTDTYAFSLEVDNNDTIAPALVLNQLTQSSVKEVASVKAGHLEEEGDSLVDGSDGDVSGEVIFSGSASDDQRIESIQVEIEGFDADGAGALTSGAAYTVAIWNGVSHQLEAVAGSGFTILTQDLTQDNGHEITWTYDWNSAEIDTVADLNVNVRFNIFDYGPNSSFDSDIYDVIPYISSIERNALYNTNRSKYGRFVAQQGETGLILNGFNLDPGATVVVHTSQTGGSLSDVNTSDAIIGLAGTTTSITGDLTNVSHSGWVRLSINGVEAGNNQNDNTIAANKEDDGSGFISTLWTDDRYLRIYEVGDYFANSSDPQHPSMSINPNNDELYGAWSNYAASMAYYSRPYSINTGSTSIFSIYDPPEYTDIYVDSDGDVHSVILENYYGGSATTSWGFLASYIGNGNRVAIDDMGDDQSTEVDHSDGYDEMLYQFKNHRFVVSNDGTNLKYVAYYDDYAKCLKYSVVTGSTGTFVTTPTHQTDSATVVDGDDDTVSAPSDTTDDVGLWLDIGFDPDDGIPIIVYYDTSNKTMKIARGQNAQPNGAGEWSKSQILSANSFSGQYVSMKVDSSGGLHIAFYKNSTGDLLYIHADDVDGGGSYSFDAPVVIDSEGSVGAWIDLTLLNDKPYISYLNSSQIGTFDGLKLAYYTGAGIDWTQDSDWEYEVVPAAASVTDKRTSIESSFGTMDWPIALGYASSTFDIIYLRPEE